MMFINDDYFQLDFEDIKFDGIITDIPYKGCLKNKLYEQNFSFERFLRKSYEETQENAFLITFTNFLCLLDLISVGKEFGWKYHTHLIWDKLPVRTWISWNRPLRHTEYILFLKKGDFKFSFKTGVEKPAYKRSSFGGPLKDQKRENFHKKSYEMYSDIIKIRPVTKKNRKHPTEKPIEFSEIFCNIVGDNKIVLDPFAGSGNLIQNFKKSIGVDLLNYGNEICKTEINKSRVFKKKDLSILL